MHAGLSMLLAVPQRLVTLVADTAMASSTAAVQQRCAKGYDR
jgi:hypothetical protein